VTPVTQLSVLRSVIDALGSAKGYVCVSELLLFWGFFFDRMMMFWRKVEVVVFCCCCFFQHRIRISPVPTMCTD